jgi:hypothetical protein
MGERRMKKVFAYSFCIIMLIISVFVFVGCGNEENKLPRSNNLPDFADCDIGYKLEVYPKVPFNYELPDGTIVHIDSIEATLTAKNEINEGDTIKEYFYPYEVTAKVIGSTDAEFAGREIYVSLPSGSGNDNGILGVINDDGSFILEAHLRFTRNHILFFMFCQIV